MAATTDRSNAVTEGGFQRVFFRKGEVLLEEDQQGDMAYLITQGKVEVRKGTRRKDPLVLAVVKPGEVVGEMALFDSTPHCAQAVAIEDVSAIAVSRDEFQARVKAMDPVIRSAVLLMVSRARRMTDMLVGQNRTAELYYVPRKK
jgi:CRP-like cAMP-binding protein